MIRATLIAVALAVGALSSEAQNPTPAPAPVPPSGEVKPAQPTPSPKARRPVVPKVWQSDDLTDLQFRLDAMKDLDFDLVTPPIPPIPPVMDIDIDMAPAALAIEHVWDAMPDIDFDFEMPDIPEVPDMPDMPDVAPMLEMTPMPEMAPMAPMAPMPPGPPTPMVPLGAMELTPMPAAIAFSKDAAIARIQGVSPFERQFGGIANSPPESWSQSDPADSLYRLAREALNHGEYRRAAQLFGDITQKFPNSVYASDSRYWKAFALYRIGGNGDLRDALATLQDTGTSFRTRSLQADAPVLATRIRAALAAQGDGDARRTLSQTASQSGTACDREDLAVKVEALNSLGQTDPEATTPILDRKSTRLNSSH